MYFDYKESFIIKNVDEFEKKVKPFIGLKTLNLKFVQHTKYCSVYLTNSDIDRIRDTSSTSLEDLVEFSRINGFSATLNLRFSKNCSILDSLIHVLWSTYKLGEYDGPRIYEELGRLYVRGWTTGKKLKVNLLNFSITVDKVVKVDIKIRTNGEITQDHRTIKGNIC